MMAQQATKKLDPRRIQRFVCEIESIQDPHMHPDMKLKIKVYANGQVFEYNGFYQYDHFKSYFDDLFEITKREINKAFSS